MKPFLLSLVAFLMLSVPSFAQTIQAPPKQEEPKVQVGPKPTIYVHFQFQGDKSLAALVLGSALTSALDEKFTVSLESVPAKDSAIVVMVDVVTMSDVTFVEFLIVAESANLTYPILIAKGGSFITGDNAEVVAANLAKQIPDTVQAFFDSLKGGDQ